MLLRKGWTAFKNNPHRSCDLLLNKQKEVESIWLPLMYASISEHHSSGQSSFLRHLSHISSRNPTSHFWVKSANKPMMVHLFICVLKALLHSRWRYLIPNPNYNFNISLMTNETLLVIFFWSNLYISSSRQEKKQVRHKKSCSWKRSNYTLVQYARINLVFLSLGLSCRRFVAQFKRLNLIIDQE